MDARQEAAFEMVVNYHNDKYKPIMSEMMKVEDLFLVSFDRVGSNWKAIIRAYANSGCMYEVIYADLIMQTTMNIYTRTEAVSKKHY